MRHFMNDFLSLLLSTLSSLFLLAFSLPTEAQGEVRNPEAMLEGSTPLEQEALMLSSRLITRDDSTRYIALLNQLYDSDPYNEKYFAWILQFYDSPKQRHNLELFVDERLQKEPDSTMPWILKGEIAMRARRWDEAVEAYTAASVIDPHSLPLIFNIGICMTNQAMELRSDKLNTKRSLSKHDINDIKSAFTKAKEYLEKVRTLDPRRKKVDWVKPLYMVYYTLGEKEKADELEPLVTGFKPLQ